MPRPFFLGWTALAFAALGGVWPAVLFYVSAPRPAAKARAVHRGELRKQHIFAAPAASFPYYV